MTPYPKIELHVHLEGTVRAATLKQIAKRNDYPLPDDLESLYAYRDFRHFIETFELTAGALQHYDDFRQIVVDYAAEASAHGAVYLEGIFVPGFWRGLDTDEVFSGYCDGAREARELHGVEVRLTPDIPSVYSAEEADDGRPVRRRLPRTRRRRPRRRRPRVPDGAVRARVLVRERRRHRLGPARRRARRAPTRCGARSTASAPTVSVTASAPSTTPGSSASSQAAGRCSTSARCPTSAPARSRPSPTTRCRGSSPRASAARSRPTTRRCSTPTSPVITRRPSRSASRPRSFYEAGVAGALCDEETRARLQAVGDRVRLALEFSPDGRRERSGASRLAP